MAIEFTKAVDQRIGYGHLSIMEGLTQKSISFFTYLDSIAKAVGAAYMYFGGNGNVAGNQEGWSNGMGISNNGDVWFGETFWNAGAQNQGLWATALNTLTVSTLHHIIITYDNSATANNPIIYVDKGVEGLTEIQTPAGVAGTGTSSVLRVGSLVTGRLSIDGWLQDFRIYDRLLPQTDVNTLCDSRLQNVVLDGLIFAPNLDGAAGLSVFDGTALAAGNTIFDPITVEYGVPNGSPIGRGNTITNIGIGVQ